MQQSVAEKRVDWIVRISVALILLQTLFFKFTGAPESIYIFSTLGIEPWGRYLSGAVELVASVLILLPRPNLLVYGAALSLGVISGALMGHLTKLGIVVLDDGGLLFGLACGVFIGSLWLLWSHRRELPFVGVRF
jgi:putative oxidoreductase